MDLILRRQSRTSAGVFSTLEDMDGEVLFYTLEHAYQQPDGSYDAKLNLGIHPCVLGQHQLAKMKEPFQAYEITEVPGHSGILFHVGNYNKDSDGCVLVGTAHVGAMISGSNIAFKKFMEMQDGKNFTLSVIEY